MFNRLAVIIRTLGFRTAKVLTIASLATSLAACATTGSPFAPKSSYSIDADINDFHEKFASATSIKDYYAQTPETVAARNAFIAGRITLYDLEYIRFVSSFRLSRAAQSSAFDGIALGIGLATTLVGPARTKTVLGAISTALTGARASYEKNFYDDKTTVALISQMNAERKTALLNLLKGSQTTSIEDYPLSQAIVDLTIYQYAGTIDGALEGVQRDASLKDAAAAKAIEQFRAIKWTPGETGKVITAWLFPGVVRFDDQGNAFDKDDKPVDIVPGNVTALKAEMKALGYDGLPIFTFTGAPELADKRAQAIKDLKIK